MKKFFKWVFRLVVLIVLIAVTAPAFMPNTAHVERSTKIKKSPEAVFATLVDLNQFKDWNPWSATEPAAPVTVSGSGVGSTYEWKGEKIGSGKSTILAAEAPKYIKTEVKMFTPMSGQFNSEYKINGSENETTVTWTFDENLSYMKRWFGLCADKMLGPDFEKGMANLKAYVEKK